MNKTKFNITIGDWSGDGHSRNKVYLTTTALTIQDVREAHFKMKSVFGFSIENICSEYEEYKMSECEVEDLLDHKLISDEQAVQFQSYVETDQMAELWVKMLNHVNPELNCELAEAGEKIPDLHFYGYDDKKRHISFVGYGLFN